MADMYYHYRSAAFYYALGRWDEANPGGDVNDAAADRFATAYMNKYSHMDIVDAWKVYDGS